MPRKPDLTIPIEHKAYRVRRRYALKQAALHGEPDNWRQYMPKPPPRVPSRATLGVPEETTGTQPPGVHPNGRQRQRRMDEAIRIGLARRAGITPLEFLLSCLRDPQVRFGFKLDAAKAAAPYMHKRMPISVQAQGPEGVISLQSAALHRLSSDELKQLCALLVKAGVGEPEFIGPDAATYAALSPTRPDGSPISQPFAIRGPTTIDATPSPDRQQSGLEPQKNADRPDTQQNFGPESDSDPPPPPDVTNTEEALRIAYEAGQISDPERPLRLPNRFAPDLDLLPDDDAPLEHLEDFDDDTEDPDFEQFARPPAQSADAAEAPGVRKQDTRSRASSAKSTTGGSQVRRHRTDGSTAAAGRTSAKRRHGSAHGEPKTKQKRQS